ncbi:hypothetical protein [Streptomyces uncialis]|uniref:hypothetical protein n=1 Tax=Streptomyces uncialis TaxID=1048205 RepID=UPI002254774A|nr:hypothetical protein [Streptomyces uncialis]MCX4660083.1 hypothetical protein [Streptomyces uncialis]
MDSSSSQAGGWRAERRRGRQIVAGLAVGFLAFGAAVFGVLMWGAEEATSDLMDQEMNCCWEKGATPAWTSELLGIRMPDSATDRRSGYKVGQRYDSALLAFVLPSEEADAYMGRLVPDDTEMIGNLHPKEKGYRPADAFGRLGLAEPETLVRGLRQTGVCEDDVDTPEGRRVQRCLDLFVHEFEPGATRVYVRSAIEPSVTPPPVSPGK